MKGYTGKTYNSTEKGNINAHYTKHSRQYCGCKSPPPINEHENETQQKVQRNRNIMGNNFVKFKSVQSFGHFYFLPQNKATKRHSAWHFFHISAKSSV
jgi:hypothetical protein